MLPFQYLKILNGTVYQSIVFHMNKSLVISSLSCFDFAAAFDILCSVIPEYFLYLAPSIHKLSPAPEPSCELQIDSRIHLDVQ